MSAAFAWFELRTHCHATEDEDKVTKAIEFLGPGIKPERTRTEGFYRNPIIVLAAWTNSQRSIKGFWRHMDDCGLVSEILNRGGQIMDDDGILHIRFGKQEAYMGRVVLAEGEDVVAVRMKVTKYPSQAGSLFDIAKETITELTYRHAPD